MKKIIIVLVLFGYNWLGQSKYDSLIEQYRIEFFNDCIKYGLTPSYNSYVLSIDNIARYGSYGRAVTDQCNNHRITFDKCFIKRAWRRHDLNKIKMICYHEFAHAFLNQKHDDNIFIMNSNNIQLFSSYKRKNIQPFINQLFGQL